MPPVEVYTTPFCPYCVSAKELLRRKGVEFVEINVAGAPERRAEMVKRASGRYTVPQIFIGADPCGRTATIFTSLTRPASSIRCWRAEWEAHHDHQPAMARPSGSASSRCAPAARPPPISTRLPS